MKHRIDVIHISNVQKLVFTRSDDGSILNYGGRSLPF